MIGEPSPPSLLNLSKQEAWISASNSTVTHDLDTGITEYINEVVFITRQLEAYGHRPASGEVTDKLLIALHSSLSAIRTILFLQDPSPDIATITTTLQEHESQENILEGEDV